MTTKLLRFKVVNFRSIEESDWIEVSSNTCLVGTNEAGKTNLLIALWKLKPANKESIRPLADYPRHLYSKYKPEGHHKDVFIHADFELPVVLQQEIAQKISCEIQQVEIVNVQRSFDGTYYITFPNSKIDGYSKYKIKALIGEFITLLNQSETFTKEPEDLRVKILKELNEISPSLTEGNLSKDEIDDIISKVKEFISSEFGKRINLPELFNKSLLMPLAKISDAFDGQNLSITPEIAKLIEDKIPKFVYYSDYGNLDSEIYLPRVIEDFQRDNLTESARAKVRTLDVLFKYVGLSPQEIYELGNDRKRIIRKVNQNDDLISEVEENLSTEEVIEWAEKKKERGVLLKSASSELTKNFKLWWQQGNYIFSFEADGSHFRINVADELRPEYIELEERSRGLQWFFSFFLVFLVETKEDHANTILLLDEPGLSLHPIAQYDLSKFFRKLSEDNQLIYTSHSPFLVDMDNLANVKAVYIDKVTGRSKVSSNLRYNEPDAEKSIYPIHAALGLTVSDTLLLGCFPILVEGASDQIYLNMIKRFLIGNGSLKYSKELVFIPTGGVRGMGPVTKLVASRENDLPHVLLDSDKVGKEYERQLINGLYKNQKNKVLTVGQFLGNKPYEIEDLLPTKAFLEIIDRTYLAKNYFSDSYIEGEPIVDQISEWAATNGISLQDGWKVDLARKVINQFERVMKDVPGELQAKWENLFATLLKINK